MNINILNKLIQQLIKDNISKNPRDIALKNFNIQGVSSSEIAAQIKGMQIAQKKFPFILNYENIYFPSTVNLEQTSSQTTAQFKANLLKPGNVLDATGGFGIDTYFFSKKNKTTYLEKDTLLFNIVQSNFKSLDHSPKYFFNITIEEYLNHPSHPYKTIYLDPSRRDKNKNKVFLLEDLSPNIIELKEKLLQQSKEVWVKLSPLFDISQCISQLKYMQDIYIIAVKNEVKELLIKLENQENNNPKIHCVNLESNEPELCFNYVEIKENQPVIYSNLKQFLYLPNHAVTKSGAFNLVSKIYPIEKLDPNTHLWTSDEIINDFFGRKFKVHDIITNPKNLKNKRFNIIIKNYPLKLPEVLKKYQLKEGGEEYLFLTTDKKGKKIIIATLL